MKILFTGGSSFTGFWFIRELARAGHEVVATFRKRADEYADELRRTRVSLALETCRGVFGCSFGDPEFVALAGRENWDLFCHHAAEVTNYKSSSFDPVSALENNTRNIAAVLDALRSNGNHRPRLLLTGPSAENNAGASSPRLAPLAPHAF